jgi:hypothetical protein
MPVVEIRLDAGRPVVGRRNGLQPSPARFDHEHAAAVVFAQRDKARDLVTAEKEIEKLVSYFEETEERLSAQNDAPAHLVETQSARSVLFAISRFLDDEAERNRAWKHADPSEVAQAFIDLVAAFVKERKLSWEELAGELHLDPRAFGRLSRYSSEEEAS